ncbi:MAG: hypothetical protein HC865_13060 [Cyanobacteria bacterium RU_5_0]|nr:hypothetical protein [Cyanobacteria bacterium RU_5_0]
MKIKHSFILFLTIALLVSFCAAPIAIAAPVPLLAEEAPPLPSNSFLDKWDRLKEDAQLQELFERDLEKSIVIRAQIQNEVDRAFSHTTTLLNALIGVLTFLPVLAAVGIWFIRRSVINQITSEIKKQLKEEVEKQLEADVTAELKQQTAIFKQEIEQLKAEFADQLAQLKRSASQFCRIHFENCPLR